MFVETDAPLTPIWVCGPYLIVSSPLNSGSLSVCTATLKDLTGASLYVKTLEPQKV